MIISHCLCSNPKGFGIPEIGDIANTIIALFTLSLGFYVFIYQRGKDKKNAKETKRKHERDIKLQWFKELIIQPQIREIYKFYDSLRSLKVSLNTDNLSEDQKINLINFIKEGQTAFRKSFIDSLQIVTPELYKAAMLNIDTLTDSLTNSISNDELKLSNPRTYEREINDRIQFSFNDLFSLIFNYRG